MPVSTAKTEEYVPRKVMVTRNILSEARRLHVREMLEHMWFTDSAGGIVVEGDALPGYTGEDITCDEISAVATASADFELWWCRAAAKQVGISVGYMDWFWHNDDTLEQAQECNSLVSCCHAA